MSAIPREYYNTAPDQEEGHLNKWWAAKPAEYYKHVFGVVGRIREQQSYRNKANLRFASLYGNQDYVGLRPGQFARVNQLIKASESVKVTYNVIRSSIDTATSKIAMQKPRPLYLTENGNWTLQQRAKRLSRYVQGQFMQCGPSGEDRTLYALGKLAFRDAAILGTSAIFFYTEDNKIKAERNMIEEIVVDEDEGIYGQPRNVHRHRYAFREVLLDLYPKHAGAIQQVQGATLEGTASSSNALRDMVEIVESWHLPSGKNAKDGVHAICIKNATLDYEEYEDDYFPFVFQRWSRRILGFYGSGLAEELIGIQLEINKLLRTVQIAQHLASVPQVWLEYAAKAVKKHIDNTIGGVKYYVGRPPIFMVPPAMSPEIYQHIERLYQKAYEISGISQLSASSRKPSGLDSGRAIREYRDIESERFSSQVDNYEDFYIQAGELIKKLSRKLVSKGKDPVVDWKDGNSLQRIRFSDVDVPDEKIQVRPYPTNFLPSTPAGKLDTVQELTQTGFYTKEEALELLDFPDLEKTNQLKLSPRTDIIKTIEKIIETETYIPPEPFMNLDLARSLSQTYYLRGRVDDMPEEILNLLRTFQKDCEALIERAKQAAQTNPQAVAQEMQTQGMPSPEMQPPEMNPAA